MLSFIVALPELGCSVKAEQPGTECCTLAQDFVQHLVKSSVLAQVFWLHPEILHKTCDMSEHAFVGNWMVNPLSPCCFVSFYGSGSLTVASGPVAC